MNLISGQQKNFFLAKKESPYIINAPFRVEVTFDRRSFTSILRLLGW